MGMTKVSARPAKGAADKIEPTAARTAEPASPVTPSPPSKQVTLKTIRKFVRNGEKFSCLTCYDATTARWLERAGVPVLLIGDTAAEMILGYPSTIHAPLDFLLTLTAAVKRGAPKTFIMGDMPFMSYQADDAEGLRNAARFLTEGMADSVKVEVDRSFVPLVQKMARAGIPVVAHVGARPQQSKRQGGYGSVGRTAAEARSLVADAVAMEDAGACMLLIEAAPNEVSQRVVEKTSVPVIGCGAGTACHGQIVVLHDLLGLTDWQPSFAKPITQLGEQVIAAATRWNRMVRDSELGEHPYRMPQDELDKL
jgi:3-methyl-2-oxobutanoate hydroxymethyltransferase